MSEIDFHGQGHGREWQCLLCERKNFNRERDLLRHIFRGHGILDLADIEKHIGYKLPVSVKEKYFLNKQR